MCGICGFTGEVFSPENIIKDMTDVISHRGPDDSGFFIDDNISMGFRRLSIIDINGGSQPIYNEDKTLVLTFNGEIYNYKILKKELQELGHSFNSNTDSEVLLHGFEEWGPLLLKKLRGMFAFAIYNSKDKSIFLARDFFGIKPLHYTVCDKELVYGSEIKSILKFPKYKKEFNYSALDNYLSFQYAVPPETFFKNVYCLLPGHYLFFKDGKITIKKYFEIEFNQDDNLSIDEAVDNISSVFENSVEAHKISDVEVGCFLSSGVDSSFVSTYFPGQKAFTVGFDFGEHYNEINWAKEFSKVIGLDHHSKIISPEEFWGSIKDVQYYMDQPLADPSCIALYFVSKLASEHVKVVLSGEGADELFGGYTVYNEPRVFRFYQKLVPFFIRHSLVKMVEKIPFHFKGKGFIKRGEQHIHEKFIGNAFMFNKKEKSKLLVDNSIATRPQDLCKKAYEKVSSLDQVSQMQYIDLNFWLVGDILLKADRMSMANSLELRVPFLDIEVYKIARTLKEKLKVNRKNTKYALRLAALKRMPQKTAEKEKLGFPVPTRVFLRDKKYYDIVKSEFESDICKKFFNINLLINLLDDHFRGKEDNSRKIWTIYVFLVWYKIYFES